jgi:importin-7
MSTLSFVSTVQSKNNGPLILLNMFGFLLVSYNARLSITFDDHPKRADEFEAFDTPISAATTFLLSLTSNRTKITFMPILGFINRVLNTYVAFFWSNFYYNLTQIGSKPSASQRFGALNMTAALGHVIMRHPDVKGSMEQFIVQHVLPEFSSSEPFVRAIVSRSLGYLDDV